MNGQLSEQPLAELISEIFRKGLSGTLRLQHESVRTIVYFDAGQIIYAASNLRELRLAEYLKKQRLVSEEHLSSFAKRSDLSLVADLSANGIVDRTVIEPLITRQVIDLLRVALLWTKGSWEFDDRSRLNDSVRVKLDTPGLLVQAARKMPLDFVRSRFATQDESISPVTDAPDYHGLLPGEGFILSRLESTVKLRELIAISGLRELDAARTIYGLALGGFIEREHALNALSVAKAESSTGSLSATLSDASPADDTRVSDLERSRKGELEDLDTFLARVEAAGSYYDALGVNNTATPEEIKSCYYTMARNYHPDRYHLQAKTPLHARIEAAFAHITQAYEILTDSKRRSAYDAKLAAKGRARQTAPPAPISEQEPQREGLKHENAGVHANSDLERAANSFNEGFAALKRGQVKRALTDLAVAARLAPQDPRYRAYYGHALAAEQRTRRLAESELLVAVKLDPANASYRLMLAELYYDLGLFRRAEGELDRAISIDPNNAEAATLMQRLEAVRTTR